jgi:hypothetical protein
MSPTPTAINAKPRKDPWKKRILRELVQYWTNVIYLAIFFGAFAWYRRFILAHYDISYLNYGTAIVEALILAKVIMLGDALGLSRGLEDRPLIYPTLYKAIVFSCFVGVFAILEHILGGLLKGKGVAGGLAELWREGKYEIIARCLINFLAFIPFFAFRELRTVLGEGKLHQLFFRRRAAPESPLHG